MLLFWGFSVTGMGVSPAGERQRELGEGWKALLPLLLLPPPPEPLPFSLGSLFPEGSSVTSVPALPPFFFLFFPLRLPLTFHMLSGFVFLKD